MPRIFFVLFSFLLCSCTTLITHDSVKIIKDTRKVEAPPYFKVSFLDHSWFKWTTEVAGVNHLEKELDRCKHQTPQLGHNLVDTCRRAWMMEVWMTSDLKKRRQLAIQALNSMHVLMQVNGWNSDKIERHLKPFEVEIDLFPTY